MPSRAPFLVIYSADTPALCIQCSIVILKAYEHSVLSFREDKMTISELGSLVEVVGAFGLIVTLVFLAMEMRLKRQSEDNRDLEQVQIRA